MATDISLTAGMRNNLLALQNTSSLIGQTQGRLSTGKKVNTPLDNPTNFFAAQNANNRASDLTNRKDGMSEALQMVNAATAGIAVAAAVAVAGPAPPAVVFGAAVRIDAISASRLPCASQNTTSHSRSVRPRARSRRKSAAPLSSHPRGKRGPWGNRQRAGGG